jgi:diguanylate cyclase (GGDEF)-like protein
MTRAFVMSRCIAALFVATALVAGAGVIVVKSRNEARARVARQAAHLVALRDNRLLGEVRLLVHSAALYSQSSDGIIAFANAGPRSSERVVDAAREALDQLRDGNTAKAGEASIRNSAGQSVLESSPSARVSVKDLHRGLPANLTGFRDLALVSTLSVVSLQQPASTPGGMAPLYLFAPIRTAVGRPSMWLSLTIPAEDLIGPYQPLAHTQTLVVGGDSDQPLPAGNRGGSAVVRSQLDKLVSQSDRRSGEVELDGHIWAYEMLPTNLGQASYPWSFVASRTQARVPTLLGEATPVPLLMSLVGAVLAMLGLIGIRRARRELERAANTDQLTGIANRAALLADLDNIQRHGDAVRVALFDLNGFKQYNDTFGHNAGDALLRRVAQALAAAVVPGRAYRLGGDEFCVISPHDAADHIEARADQAMTEKGLGFVINASWGSVAFPGECSTVPETLAMADERMYSQKRARQGGALAQTKAALKRLIAERDQTLADHHSRVASLATRVARKLDLPPAQIACICDAAELHDIGLLAIPDSIREKSGPLDHGEFEFISRHAAIGARILEAAEALHDAAAIVRATHERLDGQGYPAHAEGDQIDISAHIITVCDAYDTMTNPQAYRSAMTAKAARTELRSCVGSQFDANVVKALEAILDEGNQANDRGPARAQAQDTPRVGELAKVD